MLIALSNEKVFPTQILTAFNGNSRFKNSLSFTLHITTPLRFSVHFLNVKMQLHLIKTNHKEKRTKGDTFALKDAS